MRAEAPIRMTIGLSLACFGILAGFQFQRDWMVVGGIIAFVVGIW